MSIVEFVSQERDRYEAILDRAIAFRDMRVPGYGRATVARARRDFHRATALWLIAASNPYHLNGHAG